MYRFFLLLAALVSLVGTAATTKPEIAPAPSAAPAVVWEVAIDGPVGPATADHVVRSIETAGAAGVQALILRLDTPGGLDNAMRDIIHAILASSVPVIGYVAPQGSRAASAGTYILYACHIAAMAPATNLGAATPVQLGGRPSLPGSAGERPPAETEGERSAGDQGADSSADRKIEAGDAMHHKAVNDAEAFIRSLAELRGRNVDWAVKAVSEAATLSAAQALELGVIDLMADNRSALLRAISGRVVIVAGVTRTLAVSDSSVQEIAPDWRTQFLAVITNPNIAYLLLLIGVYGLIFELSSPGLGAGGIIGTICLLLALYALQVLPISYSALGLVVLGLGLMVAEALSPSFGILGLGGIVAFIVGSVMLLDTDVPGFRIALPIILAFALVSAGVLIMVVGLLLRSRRRAVVSGLSTLEGKVARVVRIQGDAILVRLQGELWRVRCDQPLRVGDRVRVAGARRLVLDVTKENDS